MEKEGYIAWSDKITKAAEWTCIGLEKSCVYPVSSSTSNLSDLKSFY